MDTHDKNALTLENVKSLYSSVFYNNQIHLKPVYYVHLCVSYVIQFTIMMKGNVDLPQYTLTLLFMINVCRYASALKGTFNQSDQMLLPLRSVILI